VHYRMVQAGKSVTWAKRPRIEIRLKPRTHVFRHGATKRPLRKRLVARPTYTPQRLLANRDFAPNTRMSGTIKKLVTKRGFGFITAKDGEKYFFHRSTTDDFDRLATGELVTFVTEASVKGPRATNVVTAV
jgi:CspA family cold shock protein